MITIDSLNRICSRDPDRYLVSKPFRHNEWTCATDGHVMLLVRSIDATCVAGAPDIAPYLVPAEQGAEGPVSRVSFARLRAWLLEGYSPRPDRTPCGECDGTGEVEGADCWECAGDGEIYNKRTVNAGALLGLSINRNLLMDALLDCEADTVDLFRLRSPSINPIVVDAVGWRAVVMPLHWASATPAAEFPIESAIEQSK